MTDPAVARPPNADMSAAWEGEGEHWAEHQATYDAGIVRHHAVLMDAAAIAPGEAVLDIGCGTGATTLDAARLSAPATALGVDLSTRMLERARQRAREQGLGNARFERADAQVHPFEPASFDVAISRFGGMFFDDLVAAYGNVARAVRPGGRLALLSWQALGRNEWLIEIRGALAAGRELPEPPPRGPGPFGLADPDVAQQALGEAGFDDVELREVAEPIWFGQDAGEAFAFLSTMGMARGLLGDADEATVTAALDALRATIAAHETPGGVLFDSAAWLITARRR